MTCNGGESEVEFNPIFVSRMIPKLDWSTLFQAADGVSVSGSPAELVTDYEKNEDFLCKIHRVLLEVKAVEGCLQCPDSGREFPISRGVSNMLLNEDEA
uniref:multifunctional methyltransferase subunit TRM112-like protein n=1 Tax=Oncorhynchus gorbuscha TaxID=8017 RepID=UPI001EAEDC2B|nr:multifunctional methyltransferase subunit TRM112-like protein [Oncorhynchus gorbuscha]